MGEEPTWTNVARVAEQLTLEEVEAALRAFEREFPDLVDHFLVAEVDLKAAEDLVLLAAVTLRQREGLIGRTLWNPTHPSVRVSEFVPPGFVVPVARDGRVLWPVALPSWATRREVSGGWVTTRGADRAKGGFR